MNAPEASVVIPTKDRLPLARRAVSCALGQEEVDVEVIVVDDGGSDGTAAAFEAEGDRRVRVLRNDVPRGAPAARNSGLALARGRWTAFLDDDDLWAPRKLRAQLEAAEAAGAEFAFCSSLIVDEELTPVAFDPAPAADRLLPDLLKHYSVPGGSSNVVARTELLRRLGGFDEGLVMLPDWDLAIRLAAAARAASVPDGLVGYVEHEGGLHLSGAHHGLAELRALQRKHHALLQRHPVDMGGGAWFPLWFAAGVLQSGRRLRAIALYARIAVEYRSPGAVLRALAAPFTERLARRDVAHPHPPPEKPPDWLARAAQARPDAR